MVPLTQQRLASRALIHNAPQIERPAMKASGHADIRVCARIFQVSGGDLERLPQLQKTHSATFSHFRVANHQNETRTSGLNFPQNHVYNSLKFMSKVVFLAKNPQIQWQISVFIRIPFTPVLQPLL
tara:strand:- start:14538 stop:14915 length:378 start_codon:yes stop_codon:yes gene_type:complete